MKAFIVEQVTHATNTFTFTTKVNPVDLLNENIKAHCNK